MTSSSDPITPSNNIVFSNKTTLPSDDIISPSDNSLYRPGVGIMMFNDLKQIFVARRMNVSVEGWQMPQGGIDAPEAPREAALRELEEETSVYDVVIVGETKVWYSYDFHRSIALKPGLERYRGQRQKWFAMYFQGTDHQIDLETSDPEFSDWKWVSASDLVSLIVPFKRDLYTQVIEELWPIIDAYHP